MKHHIARTMVGAICIAILCMSFVSAARADDNCSTAKAAGDWGFTLSGSLILPTGPVPAAAVLRGTADVNGNLNGTEARNVGGAYADETFSGSWTVNADCTGTVTVSFYEAGQLVRVSVATIVFSQNAREVRMVQKSLTLPDGTPVPVVVIVQGKTN